MVCFEFWNFEEYLKQSTIDINVIIQFYQLNQVKLILIYSIDDYTNFCLNIKIYLKFRNLGSFTLKNYEKFVLALLIYVKTI